MVTQFECSLSVRAFLLMFGGVSTGSMSFVTATDRLIAVTCPFFYMRMRWTYALTLILVAFAAPVPTIVVQLVKADKSVAKVGFF